MPFSSIVKAFNLRDIFYFFFDNVGTCGKGVRAITLSLFLTLETSLVVMIFFDELTLVGGKLLRKFFTGYVSRKSVSRLFFFKVLLLFFTGLYPQKHLILILRIFKNGCCNTFAFASMVFSIASFQESSSQRQLSN